MGVEVDDQETPIFEKLELHDRVVGIAYLRSALKFQIQDLPFNREISSTEESLTPF